MDRNTLPLTALTLVEEAGFHAALVMGWSRELLGLEPSRRHGDIDLVVTEPNMQRLDAWIATLDEVVEKRRSYKRAFRLEGVVVELYLVQYILD